MTGQIMVCIKKVGERDREEEKNTEKVKDFGSRR